MNYKARRNVSVDNYVHFLQKFKEVKIITSTAEPNLKFLSFVKQLWNFKNILYIEENLLRMALIALNFWVMCWIFLKLISNCLIKLKTLVYFTLFCFLFGLCTRWHVVCNFFQYIKNVEASMVLNSFCKRWFVFKCRKVQNVVREVGKKKSKTVFFIIQSTDYGRPERK